MSKQKKIVPIEELRRKAAERGAALESLSPADIELLAEELRKELGDLPDVRMDRVALAKARISKGYYTGERIAEGLIDSLRGPVAPEPVPIRGADTEADHEPDEPDGSEDGEAGDR